MTPFHSPTLVEARKKAEYIVQGFGGDKIEKLPKRSPLSRLREMKVFRQRKIKPRKGRGSYSRKNNGKRTAR